MIKAIADFTACVHMRHPNEIRGLAFSINMLWAQIFPFDALLFYENDDEKETITIFLSCR